MKTIIVVSYEEDLHAKKVMERAEEMGFVAVLWDVSKYPGNAQVSFSLYDESRNSVIVNGIHVIDLSGVYWRRPNGKYQKTSVRKIDEYMLNEGRVVTQSLAEHFPNLNWISKPGRERVGGSKPVQLKLAKDLGIRTPLTCITNCPDEIQNFIRVLGDKKLTMKPVGTSFMDLDDQGDLSSVQNKVVFTKVINPSDVLDNLDMIRNCPVIFQEAIQKDFDIRATVVDDEVYAAKIFLEGCSDTENLDWRHYEGKRVYSKYELPTEIQEQCVMFVKSLGLRFGCVDIGVSREGEHVFFEVNPQGQWLPSETKLCYDISGSIVRGLTK